MMEINEKQKKELAKNIFTFDSKGKRKKRHFNVVWNEEYYNLIKSYCDMNFQPIAYFIEECINYYLKDYLKKK